MARVRSRIRVNKNEVFVCVQVIHLHRQLQISKKNYEEMRALGKVQLCRFHSIQAAVKVMRTQPSTKTQAAFAPKRANENRKAFLHIKTTLRNLQVRYSFLEL